jgi:hypothetical protein
MLADAEDVEADLVRQVGLFEQLRESFLRRPFAAHVGERVDADFHYGSVT